MSIDGAEIEKSLEREDIFRNFLIPMIGTTLSLAIFVGCINLIRSYRQGSPKEWHNYPQFFSDVRASRPDLVVIGSSRTDAFRVNSFGDPRVVSVSSKDFEFGDGISKYAVLTLYNASFPEIQKGISASRANAFFKESKKYPVDFESKARIIFIRYISVQSWIDQMLEKVNLRATYYRSPATQAETVRLWTHRYFRKLFENGNSLNSLDYPWTRISPAIQSLKKLLVEFKNGNTEDLRLFITPTSARSLEAIELAGLWAEFEEWKRMVVQSVEQANAGMPKGKHVEIWDFDNYSCVAIEGGKEISPFWSDIDHFHPNVARAIVARMNGNQAPSRLPPCSMQDFGVKLSSENIEFHLAQIRNQQREYRSRFPERVEEVRSIYLKDPTFRHTIFRVHHAFQ
jgi:hypothetical protein